MAVCDFCGAEAQGDVCENCGAPVTETVLRVCSFCGAETPKDACEVCGAPLPQSATVVVPRTVSSSERRAIVAAEAGRYRRRGWTFIGTPGETARVYRGNDVRVLSANEDGTLSDVVRRWDPAADQKAAFPAGPVPMALEAHHLNRRPEEIISCALRYFGAGGWTATAQADRNATFAYTIPPSGCTGALLLLLGIIPGLLYFLLAKKNVTASVTATGEGSEASLYCSWSDFRCRSVCEDFYLMLSEQDHTGQPLTATRFPQPLRQ